MPWLRSNEYLSNEPIRFKPKYVLYMEKDHSDVVDSSSSNAVSKPASNEMEMRKSEFIKLPLTINNHLHDLFPDPAQLWSLLQLKVSVS